MKYEFYNIDNDNLIIIKNRKRCEITIHNFCTMCANINNDYYESILFDYEQTSHYDYKIENLIARKVLLNSMILLILRNKFYDVDMNMSINDMFNKYLNLNDEERKKLINYLRGII
jgi:hypothetical protein